jgi:hypothetical protein
MADGLADLSVPIDYRILVLNILRGLTQRFEHVGSIIRRYSPFSNFLKVQDDLLLEELHMDSTGPTAAPDGTLHQHCVPGGQATVFHVVSSAPWRQRRHQWQPVQVSQQKPQ